MNLKIGIISFYWWTWFWASSWLNLKVRNSGRWRLVASRSMVSYANNCNMTINLYRSYQRLNFNNIHKLGAIINWPNGMVSWFLLILEKAILLWLLECEYSFWCSVFCIAQIYWTSRWIKLCYKLSITYELVAFIAVCHLFFNYFLIFKWFYVLNCSNRRHPTRNLCRGTLIHEKRIKQTSNHMIISRSHISFEMLII